MVRGAQSHMPRTAASGEHENGGGGSRNVPRLRRSRGDGYTYPGLTAWAKFCRAYGADA